MARRCNPDDDAFGSVAVKRAVSEMPRHLGFEVGGGGAGGLRDVFQARGDVPGARRAFGKGGDGRKSDHDAASEPPHQRVASNRSQNRDVAALPMLSVTIQSGPSSLITRSGPAVAPAATAPADETRAIACAKPGMQPAATPT